MHSWLSPLWFLAPQCFVFVTCIDRQVFQSPRLITHFLFCSDDSQAFSDPLLTDIHKHKVVFLKEVERHVVKRASFFFILVDYNLSFHIFSRSACLSALFWQEAIHPFQDNLFEVPEGSCWLWCSMDHLFGLAALCRQDDTIERFFACAPDEHPAALRLPQFGGAAAIAHAGWQPTCPRVNRTAVGGSSFSWAR